MLAQEKDPQKIDLIYEEYDKKMKEGRDKGETKIVFRNG